jgi:hypothetical protein
MKKVLELSMIVLLVAYCRTTSIGAYSWEGKQVSKKQYDLLLYKYTLNFVNKYPKKEELKIFENLEVIYDTIAKK